MADINASASQSFPNFSNTTEPANLLRFSERVSSTFTSSSPTYLAPTEGQTANGLPTDGQTVPSVYTTYSWKGSSSPGSWSIANSTTLFTTNPGDTYTVSFYAKPAYNSQIRLSCAIGKTTYDTTFWLSNGTVNSQPTNGRATITDAGNGWYRCSATMPSPAASTATIALYLQYNNSENFTSPSSGAAFYITGLQGENSPALTAYKPTSSPLVDRPGASARVFGTISGSAATPLGVLLPTSAGKNLLTSSDALAGTYTAANLYYGRGDRTGPSGISSDVYTINANSDSNAKEYYASRSNAFTYYLGQSYTYSMYVKKVQGGLNFRLSFTVDQTIYASFNLDSGGSIIDQSASVTSASLTDVGGGWFRASVTGCATATAARAGGVAFYLLSGKGTSITVSSTTTPYAVTSSQVEDALGPTDYQSTGTVLADRQGAAGRLLSTIRATASGVAPVASTISDPVNLFAYSEDLTRGFGPYSGGLVSGSAATGGPTASGSQAAVFSGPYQASTWGGEVGSALQFAFYSGNAYTFSLYVQQQSYTYAYIELTLGSATGTVGFNMPASSIATITSKTANILAATAQYVGNGWSRVSMTMSAPTSGSKGVARTYTSGGSPSAYTKLYSISSAQIESALAPSTYQPNAANPQAVQGAQARQIDTRSASANQTFANVTQSALIQQVRSASADQTVANFATQSFSKNLIWYSDVTATLFATKTNVTVTEDQVDSPIGPLKGDAIVASSNGSSARTLNTALNYSVVAGLTYTYSVYFKKTTTDKVAIGFSNGGSRVLYYDLTAMTVYNSAGGDTNNYQFGSVSDAGNGWVRLTATFAFSSSTTIQFYFQFRVFGSNVYDTTTGTTIGYISGHQWEQNSSATSYQQSANQAATTVQPGASAITFPYNSGSSNATIAAPVLNSAGWNIHPYSDQTSTYFGGVNLTISEDTVVGPDGQMLADALVATATNTGQRYLEKQGSGLSVSTGIYTHSVYARAGTVKFARVFIFTAGGSIWASTDYDLQNGVVAANNVAGTTPTITDAGNGWYRLTCSFRTTSTSIQDRFTPQDGAGSTASTATAGDVLASVYGWQFESGVPANGYDPTTTILPPTKRQGAAARVGSIRVFSADQTIAPIVSDGAAQAPVTRSFSADQTIPVFTNVSDGKNYIPWSSLPSKSADYYQSIARDNTDAGFDGTPNTADSLVTVGSSNQRWVRFQPTRSIVGDATFSLYVRSPATRYIRLDVYASAPKVTRAAAILDFQTLTVANTVAGSGAISDAGNGWFLVSLTYTTGSTSDGLQCYIYPLDLADGSYTANLPPDTVMFVVDRIQLEPGLNPTSYMENASAVSPQPNMQGARAQTGPVQIQATADQSFANLSQAAQIYAIRTAVGSNTIGGFAPQSEGRNYLPYSNATTLAFNTQGVSISEDVTNGPLTSAIDADALVATSTGGGVVRSLVSSGTRPVFAAGLSLTFSIYARAGTLSTLRLAITDVSGNTDWSSGVYDLINGLVLRSAGGGDGRAQYVDDAGGGWWRCSVVVSQPSGRSLYLRVFAQDGSVTDSTSTATMGDSLVTLFGGQYEKSAFPTAYEGTGQVAPNRYDGAAGRVLPAPLGASASQTLDPFVVSNSQGYVYPIRLAQAANTIDAFTSNASAVYCHLASAAQTFDAFTQAATLERTLLRATGTSPIAAFTMNDPAAVAYVRSSPTVVGQAATSRTVVHRTVNTGDLVVLVAGGYSDGINDFAMTATDDWTPLVMTSGDGDEAGYHQAMFVWWKIGSPDDVSATISITLPTNYTNPVVWATSRIFRNAARIESVAATTAATPASSFTAKPLGTHNTDRTAVTLWAAPHSQSSSANGSWASDITRSDVGPGFTFVMDYVNLPTPTEVTRTRSWSTITRAMIAQFAVVPLRSEGMVGQNARANNSLDPFYGISDLKFSVAQTIPNFTSRAYNVPPGEAFQTIDPFTSEAIVENRVNARADQYMGVFVSAGFQTVKFRGRSTIDAVLSQSEGHVALTGRGNPTLGAFPSNAMAAVGVAATADQSTGSFTSGSVTIGATGESGIYEFGMDGRATVATHANTVGQIGPFTADSHTNVYVTGSAANDMGGVTSGSIVTRAVGDKTLAPFTSSASATNPVKATADQSVGEFTQVAGNVVQFRGASQVGAFASDARAKAIVTVTLRKTLDPFAISATAQTIVAARQPNGRFAVFTQNTNGRVRDPFIEARAANALPDFSSKGEARSFRKPTDHGGIKFKGVAPWRKQQGFTIRGRRSD